MLVEEEPSVNSLKREVRGGGKNPIIRCSMEKSYEIFFIAVPNSTVLSGGGAENLIRLSVIPFSIPLLVAYNNSTAALSVLSSKCTILECMVGGGPTGPYTNNIKYPIEKTY